MFVILFVLLAKAASAQILIAFFLGEKINNENLEFGLNLGLNRASIINLEPSYAGYGLNMGLSFLYKFTSAGMLPQYFIIHSRWEQKG